MNKLIILITIISVWHKYSRCDNHNDFIKLKEENGIQLSSRWIPAPGNRETRELKAAFEVDAEPSEIMELLRNEQQALHWLQGVKEMKILSAVLIMAALMSMATGIEDTDSAYVQGHVAGFWMASLAEQGNDGNETAKALYNANVDLYNEYLKDIGLDKPELMLRKFQDYKLPSGLDWQGWDKL